MKILRTTVNYKPGKNGPSNQIHEVCSRLGDDYESVVTTNIEYIKNNAHKFDIIHAHNYRCVQTTVARILARKYNKPFVVQSHGSITGYKHALKFHLPYKLYDYGFIDDIKKADIIIASTKNEKREIELIYNPDAKIVVIPSGIDADKYYTKRVFSQPYILLFVGNISRNRNLEPMIKAVQYVKNNIKLRIVGPEYKSSRFNLGGYIKDLKKLAGPNVEFIGPKYGDDLIQEYKKAHFFIYTSKYENFGQTILEAAASGLPLITTSVGVANEMPGRIINTNPKEIAKVIDEVCNMIGINCLGEYFNWYANYKFNWNIVVEKYKKLYASLS